MLHRRSRPSAQTRVAMVPHPLSNTLEAVNVRGKETQTLALKPSCFHNAKLYQVFQPLRTADGPFLQKIDFPFKHSTILDHISGFRALV